VFTPDDWRLDPVATLKALDRALREAGVRMVAARLQAFEAPRAVLSDGETLPADGLIVATGAQAAHLAPELASLVPIKGQILGYPTLPVPEGAPALRCADGYAVGGPDGLQVGATMQAGARDLAVDPAVTDRLHALAVRLYPQAADLVPVARVGVRAAATDGPPMIGPSARDGVWIAAGARRNGWLLGPLAAQIIVAGVQGRDLGAFAGVLKPRSPA
jgi:glycine oxidase